MMGQRTSQYSTLSLLLMVPFMFFPCLVHAQDCEPAKQRIYQIELQAQHIPDSLSMMLDLVAFVRGCENEVALALELWLLINEVLALNGLERYDEAREKTDRFFANYFDEEETSDSYRARFLMWRLHLSARNGADSTMVRDYTQAQKYAYALGPTRRASLMADGANAFAWIGEYETALLLAQEARTLIGTPQSYDEQLVTARALLLEAESQVWLRRALLQAQESLMRAASLYGTLGDPSKVATATALLGLALAAEGDTTAGLARMENAVRIAERSGDQRSQIYTLFLHGQLRRKAGDHLNAEQILTRALESANMIQEFHLFIAYELALLYDQREQLDEATRLYRVVLDAPRPRRHAAAIDAELKARNAENRLLMIKSDRDRNTIGLLLLVLLAIGFVLFLRRKPRPPSPLEHGTGGFYLPYEMPTGLMLSELKARFLTLPDVTELVARRLAYAYAILFDRALIRAYITDEYYKPQVEEDRLKDNSALFLCIAQIETAVDQQVFSGRPNNSIRAHLDGAFKKYGWHWPSGPIDWKRYFMKYHMDLLFGDASLSAPEANDIPK